MNLLTDLKEIDDEQHEFKKLTSYIIINIIKNNHDIDHSQLKSKVIEKYLSIQTKNLNQSEISTNFSSNSNEEFKFSE